MAAEQQKFLSLEGLTTLVANIKAGDAAALKAAKDYVGAIPAGATQTTVIAYLESLIAEAKKAENVSIADANNHYTSTTVEDALAEIATTVEGHTTSLTTITGDANTAGSIAKALKDAKDYTDTEIGELKIGDTSYSTVKAYVDAKDSAIVKLIDATNGDLSTLTTDAKTDLVVALNEVDSHADAANAAIGTAKQGETAGTGLTGRIEVLEEAIGEGGGVSEQIKTAIEALDADITSSAVETGKGLQVEVKETDGKVTEVVVTGDFSATYDAIGSAATAKSEAIEASVVTVEKQETAEEGYAATYYIKQNGTKVGDSINVAKDWLLSGVELKTCTEADKPITGLKVGDKYFDFTFNVKVGTKETAEHVYLNVNDLYDSYTSGSASTDAVVIVVDNDTNKISATVTDGTISRAKIDADFEADIAALEGTHATTAEGALKSVSTQISEEAKNAEYKAAQGTVGEEGYKEAVSIKGAIDDIYTQIGEGGGVATQIANAINALDATVTNEVEGEAKPDVTVTVTETDGKLTAVSATVNAKYDAEGAAAAVSGYGEGETAQTVKQVAEKVDAITSITETEITDLFKPSES